MKKILYILIVFLIFPVILLSGCGEKSQTPPLLNDIEVIAETKNYLSNKFSDKYIYNYVNLPNSYTVQEKYKAYITWTSSNISIINPTTGNVNRTQNEQHCNLTAHITYNVSSDIITFYLSVAPNKYENNSTNFSTSSSASEIQASIASLVYNNSTITMELYLFNNLKSKKIFKGITDFTFSIKTYSSSIIGGYSYLVKEVTYTNKNNRQFSCNYHEYVKIKIDNIPVYNKLELFKNNYFIEVVGNFTCYVSL